MGNDVSCGFLVIQFLFLETFWAFGNVEMHKVLSIY